MARSLRVRFESREAFTRAWEESLGKGAVFVHDDRPPPLQARVAVQLELAFAGAKASLEGEVIQHVPASAGAEAGVAVQLLAPVARLRQAFERFLAPSPPEPVSGSPEPAGGSLFEEEDGGAAASEPPAEPLDPSDPFSFEVSARVLADDDPEPQPDPDALPPPGQPFDPHERELD